MVSTYTGNLGVEKPGSGDQAGTWGTTTNNNFDIFDRAIAGVGAITLSGTTHTLTTTDGVLSDGGFRVLVLGGSPSGTNTITISPNDQDKVYLVDNRSGQSVIFTQGSGGNDTLVNGEMAWIFADGAGASAAVKKASLLVSQITDLTATAAELNIMDGVTATANELNILDGVTATTAELNYSDTGASTGVVVADKVVTVDSNKDVSSFRNITLTGELDAASLDISGDADIDGTLEADAMTLNGTAITTTATLSTGISNTNVLQCNANVADDDFLRIDGTSVEGRSAVELLSDIGALPLSGGTVSGQVTITTADNNAQLTLVSTDDDSSAGPRLDLTRDSASPADDDNIGRIRFMFDNDAGEETRAAVIDAVAADVTDGTEDATLQIKTMSGGSLLSRVEVLPTETVINQDGEAINLRVESDTDANAFVVDATNSRVGIGTLTPGASLEVFRGSTSEVIIGTDSGGTAQLSFYEINDSTKEALLKYDGVDNRLHLATSGAANALVIARESGDVSLGTTVTSLLNAEGTTAKLTVAGSDTSTTITGNGGAALQIVQTDGTAGNTAGLHFSRQDTDGTPNYSGAAIVAQFPDAQVTGQYPKGLLAFNTSSSANAAPTEKMRIESNGFVLIGQTSYSNSANVSGAQLCPDSPNVLGVNADTVLNINRRTNDGTLISLKQDATQEGSISVSGTTVSFNGGHLARWSQATDGNRINGLVKGTVMTNLDQMCEWTKDGVTEDNEQLNCMAVSTTAGDPNVAGVFVSFDEDDNFYTADMIIAMTGDMVIRIAQGTTVARGDLLESAGDGTAKPQGEDIVRSKTIAKVTSTHVSHTYDDGSYLVPCVLMAS